MDQLNKALQVSVPQALVDEVFLVFVPVSQPSAASYSSLTSSSSSSAGATPATSDNQPVSAAERRIHGLTDNQLVQKVESCYSTSSDCVTICGQAES